MTIFKRSADLAWRNLGDETIVLDIRGNRVVSLNPAAGRVWQAIAQEGTSQDIADRVACGSSRLDRGVLRHFLHELRSHRLVEAVGPSSVAEDADPLETDANDTDSPAVLWAEDLQRFAGCGKTAVDFGIPDCMTSTNLS